MAKPEYEYTLYNCASMASTLLIRTHPHTHSVSPSYCATFGRDLIYRHHSQLKAKFHYAI